MNRAFEDRMHTMIRVLIWAPGGEDFGDVIITKPEKENEYQMRYRLLNNIMFYIYHDVCKCCRF